MLAEHDLPLVLIDDSIQFARLLMKGLVNNGVPIDKIHHISDPRFAIDLITRIKPKTILVDCNMPHMDGYVLMSEIRRIPSLGNLTSIMVTANALEEVRAQAISAGFDYIVQKGGLQETIKNLKSIIELFGKNSG